LTYSQVPKLTKPYKNPVSVLVVVYSADGYFLLIERAANPGYWQSVTGSQEHGESLAETAIRELKEETGLIAEGVIRKTEPQSWNSLPANVLIDHHQNTSYEIFPEWRDRYAPGVTQNTEHFFSIKLHSPQIVQLSPEHRAQRWMNAMLAAEVCFSPSNRVAINHIANQEIVTKPV
jgi:dATP pyrophosphohydrolase